MMEIETDEPLQTQWMAHDGTLWDRESDAIEHTMNSDKAPSLIYYCPECGDWKYTADAARECCD